MMFWDILVTAWIAYKTTLIAVRARDQHLLKGHTMSAANGAFAGTISAGVTSFIFKNKKVVCYA